MMLLSITKKLIKTGKLLLMVALTGFSALAHAHGAGNGGGSLILTGPPVGNDEVVVAPPAFPESQGELVLAGEAGVHAGQTDQFFLTQCQGELPTPQCQPYNNRIRYHLNDPARLTAGVYKLDFSGMIALVQIHVGQTTRIELKRLRIAPQVPSIQFKVFLDLTDPGMQLNFVHFSMAMHRAELLDYLHNSSALPDTSASRAVTSGDPIAWGREVISFDSEGVYFGGVYDYIFGAIADPFGKHSFQNNGRNYIWDSQRDRPQFGFPTGNFVSVFPGVYGVEFINTETGNRQSRYGVRVE